MNITYRTFGQVQVVLTLITKLTSQTWSQNRGLMGEQVHTQPSCRPHITRTEDPQWKISDHQFLTILIGSTNHMGYSPPCLYRDFCGSPRQTPELTTKVTTMVLNMHQTIMHRNWSKCVLLWNTQPEGVTMRHNSISKGKVWYPCAFPFKECHKYHTFKTHVNLKKNKPDQHAELNAHNKNRSVNI